MLAGFRASTTIVFSLKGSVVSEAIRDHGGGRRNRGHDLARSRRGGGAGTRLRGLSMKQFLFGFIAALLLIAAAGLGYVSLGLAPVATGSAPLPFEKLITGIALNARINKEAPKSSPIPASDEGYAAGIMIYRKNCAVCHGLPGQDQTAIGKGEFPKPPELFKGEGVTNDPVGETYWKVANGIRLTGMPGFSGSLTTAEMWQVSLFVANVNKLPAKVQRILQEPLVQ